MKKNDTGLHSYSFVGEIAKEVGLKEAIILENLRWWILHNQENNKNFYEGSYWTFNSYEAFTNLFPFFTKKQIRLAITNLKEQGYIKVGSFNKSYYDKTNWYTLTDKGWALWTTASAPQIAEPAPVQSFPQQAQAYNGQELSANELPSDMPVLRLDS